MLSVAVVLWRLKHSHDITFTHNSTEHCFLAACCEIWNCSISTWKTTRNDDDDKLNIYTISQLDIIITKLSTTFPVWCHISLLWKFPSICNKHQLILLSKFYRSEISWIIKLTENGFIESEIRIWVAYTKVYYSLKYTRSLRNSVSFYWFYNCLMWTIRNSWYISKTIFIDLSSSYQINDYYSK